jgi:hypothetical protein
MLLTHVAAVYMSLGPSAHHGFALPITCCALPWFRTAPLLSTATPESGKYAAGMALLSAIGPNLSSLAPLVLVQQEPLAHAGVHDLPGQELVR